MRYEFAGFQFDLDRGLTRMGESIRLARKPRGLLEVLLAERGGVVAKEQIVDRVWGRGDVSDDSIFRAVYALRRGFEAFDIDPIETVHGVGFRMAVPVAVAENARPTALGPLVRSESAAAVESLMVAIKFRARRSPEDFATAAEAARRATELDPNCVLAWANLAELHALEGIRWYHPPQPSFEAAREAARRALAVDPGSPAALAVDGFMTGVLDLDFAGGIARIDQAVAADPTHVIGRTLRAFLRQVTGCFDLAETDLRVALELNPLAAHAHHSLCWVLLWGGRIEEMREEAQAFATRCPTIDNTLNQWAMAAAMLGRVDEAISAGRMARQISPATPQMHVGLLMALIAGGRRDEAARLLGELRASPIPAPPSHLAPALLAMGDRDGAVAMLERGRDARCLHFLTSEFDPRIRELAQDAALAPLWAEVRAARRLALDLPGVAASAAKAAAKSRA